MKKMASMVFALALALLLTTGARADAWSGQVEADAITLLTADSSGALTALDILPGQLVSKGDILGSVAVTRHFAPSDGTVAAIHFKVGDTLKDTVVEIEPVSPYVIHCTLTDGVSAENAAIHCGETLWMKCTSDGSHRAFGRVTSVEGSDYQVEALGGELYIGETVSLYRDTDFAKSSLVGRGTVVASETIAVTAEGTLTSLSVAQGARVERGQLLFTTASAEETNLVAPCGGIVTEVLAQAGDSVQEQQALARIAADVALRAEVSAEDLGRFQIGQRVAYLRGDDPHETPRRAVVTDVLMDTENGGGTIVCQPEENLLPIGLSITLTDDAAALP